MNKTTSELIQIASAGGGLRLDAARRTTSELIQIASAASGKRAMLHLYNVNKTTSEMIQIASAGKGCVIFEG